MDIYTVFMITAIILGIFFVNKNTKLQGFNKKKYCVILGGLLFLISGLRGESVGVDSWNYARMFSIATNMNFTQVIAFFEKDLGFYIAMKIMTLLSSDHQVMFIVIALIYSYSISRFIYKYSKDPMVSFIMLITMSYFAFSLTGLRQIMALSIILFSYDYIIRKHFLKFVFTVIIASLFHQSALLFLPAYFISNKKINSIKVIIGVPAAFIVFASRSLLVSLVQVFMYENYSIDLDQGAGGWTTLFVYFLIIIVAVVFSKQIKNEYFPYFLKVMYVGALIQMFVPLQPNIFRVSMYYNIASIILIPDILKTQKDKFSKVIAYSLFFILMGIQYYVFTYYAAGVQPYKFFWQ